MPEPTNSNGHWLVSAWPGMGNVAVIAAGYFIQKLGLRPVAELPPRSHFDVQSVDVSKGVIATPRLPRSFLFRGPEREGSPRLTVFLGEAQPAVGAYTFAHELLERAKEFNIDRIVTFASMATQIHPTQAPSVFGAATKAEMLGELERLDVKPIEEGQIGGLNGVLLGAAAERHIPGICLLGEIPYFAAGVPNPKAAKAVLEAFALMSGFEIDVEELGQQAEQLEPMMLDLLERMRANGDAEGASSLPDDPISSGGNQTTPEPPSDKKLDAATRDRIEQLFEDAKRDRSRAMALKQELDRHGVFKQYENRFLDLFKRGE